MCALKKKLKCVITVCFLHTDWPAASRFTNLDRTLQLGFLIPQPHHPNDCQGDAEPVEEAEEVYDGENVIGEGVEQRHQTLERARRREREREAVRTAMNENNLLPFLFNNGRTHTHPKFKGK